MGEDIRRQFSFAIAGLLAMVICCGVSRANGFISDPRMSILEDEFSNALSTGSVFSPDTGGGGVIGFYNPSGERITELTLTVTIAAGLDPSVIAQAFACNVPGDSSGFSNPFFLHCGYSYATGTGVLTIGFWGTNPLFEADEFQVGDHLGIPPLLPGCATMPDAPGCTGLGHFAFDLNDSLTVAGGGWSQANNPVLFANGPPSFQVQQFGSTFGFIPSAFSTPEPGALVVVGSALVGLAFLRRRRIT